MLCAALCTTIFAASSCAATLAAKKSVRGVGQPFGGGGRTCACYPPLVQPTLAYARAARTLRPQRPCSTILVAVAGSCFEAMSGQGWDGAGRTRHRCRRRGEAMRTRASLRGRRGCLPDLLRPRPSAAAPHAASPALHPAAAAGATAYSVETIESVCSWDVWPGLASCIALGCARTVGR